MPRIPDILLESVVYLYPSVEAATAGQDAGGTGFIVLRPYDRMPQWGVLCIVTNKHVAARAPVPRLNRKDGGAPDCLPVEDVHWMYHRGPHDLAVLVGVANQNIHRFTPIKTEQLLTRKQAEELAIGIGDDVFMLGRFIGHEGRIHNEPTARMGNISAPPRMMRNIEAEVDEESFAVEMRSKPGYSGSPTFVWNSVFNNHLTPSPRPGGDAGIFVKLLGVNWGQIYEKRPLRDKNGKEISGPYVTEASGMNGVVPAWHILSLLEQKEVADILKEFEDRGLKLLPQINRAAIEPSAAETPSSAKDANPQHREDFTSLLNAAARKQPQDD